MKLIPAASVVAGALLVSGLPVSAQPTTVTDLLPLTLPLPVNHVFRFTSDGRTATITRDPVTEGARLVDLYRIRLLTTAGKERLVPIIGLNGDNVRDVIPDDPTGERRTFRLAYGRIDHGKQDMLLITADLEGKDSHFSVDYMVYRLVNEQFRPVLTVRSTEAFCTAEAALRREFMVALRLDYRGPHTPDGCPPGGSPSVASAGTALLQPAKPPAIATLVPAPPPARRALARSIDVAGPRDTQSRAPQQTEPTPSQSALQGEAAPAPTQAGSQPAPVPQAASPEDCADVNRQQHLALCESFVFRQMHNTAVEEAKGEEWSLRAQVHPQCRNVDGARTAYDAGQRVWQQIKQKSSVTEDDKLQMIVAGCLLPQ